MTRNAVVGLWLLCAGTLTWAAEPANWPSWRGPDANGIAARGNPPVEWSETSNLRWKVDIPGKGSSSPIVWGNRIFVTTAVPPAGTQSSGRRSVSPDAELEFTVLAYDRNDGRVLWRKVVRKGKPSAGTHSTGTWASNSPVTDGQRLLAYFGSQGLYCLDLDGNVQWEKDFGDMDKRRSFGEGSSPALHGDRVFVLWDHEGPSYLFALDAATGKQLWRVERDEISSWSTPLVVEQDGKTQVITNATGHVRSYDAASGRSIWHVGGMTDNVIPTPVLGGGTLYVASGFRGAALLAIRLAGANGDLSGSDAIRWSLKRDTPYTPSPLLYGDTLYVLKGNRAVLSVFDSGSGTPHYTRQRLPEMGTVYASPVGASGRVYICDRDGKTIVLRDGPTLEVLATNQLDDIIDASPAIVGDELILRGHKYLYSIGE